MAFLEIENFTKRFDSLQVLKGVDLSVNKGEVVSIIGSSGSGKSTFLRCINFLETPNCGKMTLDGEVLLDRSISTRESDKILRKKRLNFGLVFQSFNLFPQYSVYDNITLAPKLLLKEKLKKAKKTLSKPDFNKFKLEEEAKIFSDATELLETIGLSEKKDNYPCQLSGGQCQRVAIARALALKPKILCFDEPTSALDPELTGEVLKVIRSLKNQDRTMIIVTHEMGFAKNVSDKVVFMHDGVIAEQGKPSDVLDNPKTEELRNFLANVINKEE